jgi:hypothetical protein
MRSATDSSAPRVIDSSAVAQSAPSPKPECVIEMRVPDPSVSKVMQVSIGPGRRGTGPPLWR